MNTLSTRRVLGIGLKFFVLSALLLLATFAIQAFAQTAIDEEIISGEVTVSEESPADFFVPVEDTLTPPSIALIEDESSTTAEVIVEEESVVEVSTTEETPLFEVMESATVLLSQTPELTTDKEEYSPEETATISGRFFGSLKNIFLRFVAGSLLEPEEVYFEDTATVTTDEEGAFTFDYELSHIFAPLYRIFAEDEEGNILAEDSFIDPLQTSFTQCANEDPLGCDWIGSIIQQSNSVYYEGMTVPQRLLFRDAAVVNGNHTISFTYQYTKAGIHAYDFLSTVNPKLGIAQGNGSFTPGTPVLDPCGELNGQDLTTCNALNPSSATPAQIAIPNDSFDSKDAGPTGQTDKENAFEALTAMDRYISAYSRGGTVTFGVPTLAHSSVGANSDTGDTEVTITIPFTTNGCASGDSCDILLYFGGHLAVTGDGTGETWGPGLGSSQISGGPYHIKTVKFDGTGGSQDNQIKGADILQPPEPGKIIVVKQTIPDGNTTDFTFNPSWSANDFVLSDGEQNDSGDLDAGVYNVSETVPNGWTQTSATCSDNSPINAINVAEGETVTCTFTNTLQQAHLTLLKTVVNDNGGTAVDTDWTLSASGPTNISGIEGNAAVTNAAVNAGAYTLSESTGPAGYIGGTFSCVKNGGQPVVSNSITLAGGDNATCTITNNDEAPSLTLIKEVVNDNGGTAVAGDWTLTADGYDAQSPDAGTYDLSESGGPTGYTQTSLTCSNSGDSQVTEVTLGLNEDVTCTFVNNDQQAYITVTKVVTNDNGGSAQPNDFALKLEGNAVSSGVQVPVNPGTYTASETLLSGYTFEGFTGDCDSNGDVTVALGESKSCTLTNNDQSGKIKIIKNTLGGNGTFDFTVTGPTASTPSVTTSDGTGSTNDIIVNAGSYAVSETVPAGWDLTNSSCTSGTPGSFSVPNGGTVTCTFENTKRGSITIEKQTLPDGSSTDFTFTGDVAGTLSDDETAGPISVAPGTYSSTEEALAGWDLTNIVCDDINSSGNVGARVATFNVEAGENVKCTFTNTQRAHVIIVKDVIGNPDSTDFTFNNNFGLSHPATFMLDEDSDGTLPSSRDFEVLPGTYAVSEDLVSGWQSPESTSCTNGETIESIDVAPGETVTCTFVNEKLVSITLIKNTLGGDGDFDFDATGPGLPTDIDLTTVGGTVSQTFTGLDQDDEFSIAETIPAGWMLVSATCTGGETPASITPEPGEDVTCTFTNGKLPTLTLNKTVVKDHGGSAVANDFQGKIDGLNVPWGVAQTLTVGNHTASEVTLPTYASSIWGTDCGPNGEVTLGYGENEVCSITNDDVPAHLIVIKHVINDNGGTKLADDFTTTISSVTTANPTVPGVESPGVDNILTTIGTYSVDEGSHDGYAKTLSAGCTGTIALGETKTCVITNDDIAPKLTLVKEVVNDNGGAAVAADWTLTAALYNTGNPQTGTYNLSESGGPEGYTLTSLTCDNSQGPVTSVTLGLADDVTCTFVNDDVAPKLHLVKKVNNNHGGTAATTDWTLTANGLTSISGAGGTVSGDTFSAGAYTLSESTGPAHYVAGDWSCEGDVENVDDEVTLGVGQEATCTIENSDTPAKLTVIKHVVNNNGGSKTASDFTMNVTGTNASDDSFAGSEAGVTVDLDAGAYSADEIELPGYTKTIGTDCSGTIAMGESKTCTITNDDQQAYITVVKVVENDHGGTAAPDDFDLTLGANNTLSGVKVPVNPGTYDVGETLLSGYEFVGYTGVCVVDDGNTDTLNLIADWKTKREALIAAIVSDPSDDDTTKINSVEDIDVKITALYNSLQASVTVALGEDKTCTLTNKDLPGYVIVDKVVINDNGGTAVANDFPLEVDGNGTTDGAMVEVAAGAHDASETSLPTYTAGEWGGDCESDGSVEVGLNEIKVCTITNDDIAPKLTLVKEVVNDNGGAAVAADWTLTAALYNTGNPQTGTYNLSESGGPEGYTLTSLTCDNSQGPVTSVTLGLADDVTCTFVNDDVAPKLHLRKVVMNDNGGTAIVANFTLTADGSGGNDISGTSPVDSGATLQTGTFALSETNLAGYAASAWSCVGGTQNGANISLGLGEEATCTITNDDIAPKLTLNKIVINDNTGVATESSFTLTANGGLAGTLSGPGAVGNTDVVSGATFKAGTYALSEAGPKGYKASAWSCVKNGGSAVNGASIALALGDTATCTITNDDLQPTRTIGFWQTHTAFTSKVSALPTMQKWVGVNSAVVLGSHKGQITNTQSNIQSQLFGAFYSSIPTMTNGKKRSATDKTRMVLLQQLVAAKLNCAAVTCNATTLTMIADADLAYKNGSNTMGTFTSKLDAFNNSGDAAPLPLSLGSQGSATPDISQLYANKSFWDTP